MGMQVLVALLLGIKRNGHIFIGLLLGILIGCLCPKANFPQVYNILDFIGQAFIALIQVVVLPLVVSAIIIGISNIGDSKQLTKLGGKMLFYYTLITVAAIGISTTISMYVKPGISARNLVSPETISDVHAYVANAMAYQKEHMSEIFLNLIPKNIVASLGSGDMIAVIAFVMVFAIALTRAGEISRPLISVFESIFAATMKVTDWIMYLAAPGVFALTATAVSNFGIEVFSNISKYAAVVFICLLLQFFVVYPLMLKIFSKVSPRRLFGAMSEAIMVAFGTASSSATLPLTITCCEKRGISNRICSFVLPLGTTLNMDGTIIMQIVATVFLLQMYDVHISVMLLIQISLLAVIASSTCVGISGAGLITIVLILNGIGLTTEQIVQGYALLFTLERIMDMFRTVCNVASDTVVAAIIADNENELNYELLCGETAAEKA